MYSDLSWVKPKDGVKNTSKPYWHMMVDEKTNLKFSEFYSSKSGLVEPTCVKGRMPRDKRVRHSLDMDVGEAGLVWIGNKENSTFEITISKKSKDAPTDATTDLVC